MIKKNNGEVWKQINFNGSKQLRNKYAISSHGRAASYSNDVLKDGKLLKGSVTSGYRTLNLHIDNSNGTIYIHRQVAKLFCKKPSSKYEYVIHLNHKKTDNIYTNLKWATADMVSTHQQNSPEKIAYKKKQANRTVGLKLPPHRLKQSKTLLINQSEELHTNSLQPNIRLAK